MYNIQTACFTQTSCGEHNRCVLSSSLEFVIVLVQSGSLLVLHGSDPLSPNGEMLGGVSSFLWFSGLVLQLKILVQIPLKSSDS